MAKGLPLLLLLTGLLFSCSPREGGRNSISLPEPGIVHNRQICTGDNSVTYALYVPRRIVQANSSKVPVIIAFDPQASGSTPVSDYRELADRYGYILMGSNDARNGLPPERVDQIVSTLFTEARSFDMADTSRIILMGFSGGARIATLSAFYKLPASGIIACGAGLAGASGPPVFKADYFGLAGLADFNMNEMVQLEYPLAQAGIRHAIYTFDGGHAWPPVSVMEDVFRWYTLTAQYNKNPRQTDSLTKAVTVDFTSRIRQSATLGDLIGAAGQCRLAVSMLGDTANGRTFDRMLDSLINLPGYQQQSSYRKKIMEDEETERQMLMNALTEKDTDWWKARNEGYEKVLISHGSGDWHYREDSLRTMRIRAFLGLLCYMNANSILESANADVANRIVTIYEYCDPSNPEPHYMRAILLARKPDNNGALKELERAVAKGFNARLRMMEQPEFDSVKNLPGFYDLQKMMK